MNDLARPDRIEIEEPQFLLRWETPADPIRTREAAAISIGIHLAAIAMLALLPSRFLVPISPHDLARHTNVTPLVAPQLELTQKEPNRGKISKEVDIESLMPRPPLHAPPGVPAFRPTPRVPAAAATGPAPAPLIEPPKVEAPKIAQAPALGAGNPAMTPAPPPQIQPEEKPKLAFEKPGSQSGPKQSSGGGQIPRPNTSVDEAIRSVARGRGGGMVVGDPDVPSGIGGGMTAPGLSGKPGSSLEMLSDPMGIDFRPYLIRILATVRRNWMAVIPEVARFGYRGRVQIQFAIARDGGVPKLVIATPSGLEAFDRAAVAGISASNPFPPLPPEYRGNQVRLQFTFLYNMPR